MNHPKSDYRPVSAMVEVLDPGVPFLFGFLGVVISLSFGALFISAFGIGMFV